MLMKEEEILSKAQIKKAKKLIEKGYQIDWIIARAPQKDKALLGAYREMASIDRFGKVMWNEKKD